MGFWRDFFLGTDQQRALYTRTDGDLLTQDDGGAGWITWSGYDSGGGAYPIGPNGPFGDGHGPFQAVVTRATSLITGPLTSAPFQVTGSDVPPRWITDPMLVRPDARFEESVRPAVTLLPRNQFWKEWLRAAIWYGLGPLLFAEDAQQRPIPGTMSVLNPLTIETRQVDGVLRWTIPDPGDEHQRVVFGKDGRLRLGPVTYRLLMLRNPHSPVNADGMSRGVFETHPDVFKITEQITRYTSGTFRSGVPAGYLKYNSPRGDLDHQAAAELRRSWMENHGGDRRSIAVLNSSIEFVPLNLSPVDAALGDVKTLAIADVAMAFGLDPMTLGAGLKASMTYSNLRDSWQNHRDFGLAPWVSAVRDALSPLLPAGHEVVVDLDDFANPPPKERYEAGKVAVQAGLMTVDEWRAGEGLPPMPKQAAPPLQQPEEGDDADQATAADAADPA